MRFSKVITVRPYARTPEHLAHERRIVYTQWLERAAYTERRRWCLLSAARRVSSRKIRENATATVVVESVNWTCVFWWAKSDFSRNKKLVKTRQSLKVNSFVWFSKFEFPVKTFTYYSQVTWEWGVWNNSRQSSELSANFGERSARKKSWKRDSSRLNRLLVTWKCEI